MSSLYSAERKAFV